MIRLFFVTILSLFCTLSVDKIEAKCASFEATFLYWNVVEPHLDYAVKRETLPSFYEPLPILLITAPSVGSKHYLEYDWDPGVRLSFHLSCGCEKESSLVWTYLQSDAKDSVRAGYMQTISPILLHTDRINRGNPYRVSGARYGKAENNLDYQTLDWTFGGPLCFIECLEMRSSLGLRGAQINQQLRAFYEDLVDAFAEEQNQSAKLRYYSEFRGLGPILRLQTACAVCGELGLRVDGGVFALFANRDEKNKQTFVPSDFVFVDMKGEQWVPTAGYELEVGVDWGCHFGCSRFSLSIGYSCVQWLTVPQVGRFFSASYVTNGFQVDGPLTLHGLKAQVGVVY